VDRIQRGACEDPPKQERQQDRQGAPRRQQQLQGPQGLLGLADGERDLHDARLSAPGREGATVDHDRLLVYHRGLGVAIARPHRLQSCVAQRQSCAPQIHRGPQDRAVYRTRLRPTAGQRAARKVRIPRRPRTTVLQVAPHELLSLAHETGLNAAVRRTRLHEVEDGTERDQRQCEDRGVEQRQAQADGHAATGRARAVGFRTHGGNASSRRV